MDTDHSVYSVTIFPGNEIVDMQYAKNHLWLSYSEQPRKTFRFINYSLSKIISLSQDSEFYLYFKY